MSFNAFNQVVYPEGRKSLGPWQNQNRHGSTFSGFLDDDANVIKEDTYLDLNFFTTQDIVICESLKRKKSLSFESRSNF